MDLSLVVGKSKDNYQKALFPFGDRAGTVIPSLPKITNVVLFFLLLIAGLFQNFDVIDDYSGATFFTTDDSPFWGSIYTAGASGALYILSLTHVLKADDVSTRFSI